MAQSEKRRLGGIMLPQQTAPANPVTSHATLYVGTDGEFHWRTPGGVDQAFLLGQSPVYVTHGANASTARPAVGTRPVVWRGSVQPTNWTAVDVWEDTSGGGGGGTVTYAAPVTLTPDVANTEGVATTVARSDHVHNVPAATAIGLSFTSTSAEGTASDFARSDHSHAITAFDTTVPTQVTATAAAATGSTSVAARRDHIHNISTAAPSTALTASSTNAVGSAASLARSDHMHAITGFLVQNDLDVRKWKEPVRVASTANLTLSGTQTIDGVAVVAGDRVLAKDQTTGGQNGIYVVAASTWTRGSGTNTAAEVTQAVTQVLEGTTNAGGVFYQSATIATLGTTVQTWGRINTAGSTTTFAPAVGLSFTTTNAEGAAATSARSDHTHAITAFDATAPGQITATATAAAGSATVAARRDHVHSISTAAPASSLTASTTNAVGSAASLARSDHSHAITGFLPTTGGTLTGALTLSGAPTVANHAATKAYVDGLIPSGGNNVQSTTVTNIVKLTRVAYDALGTKDAATLYVVVG